MITIRKFLASDTESVDLILACCTQELRAVYSPKPVPKSISEIRFHSSRIVAIGPEETVVGVAECIYRQSALYVQGIAVSPAYRRHGAATNLLTHCNSLASAVGLNILEITTIKETGNADIFCRLGFLVADEQISDRFWRHDKQPVTEVTLRRHVI